MSSSSAPDSGGAKTVAGSPTETSSPAALVSVPAQGVAPAGVLLLCDAEAAGAADGEGAGAGTEAPCPYPPPPKEPDPELDPEAPEPDAPEPEAPEPGAPAPPILSAASCSHSGGVSRKDV